MSALFVNRHPVIKEHLLSPVVLSTINEPSHQKEKITELSLPWQDHKFLFSYFYGEWYSGTVFIIIYKVLFY